MGTHHDGTMKMNSLFTLPPGARCGTIRKMMRIRQLAPTQQTGLLDTNAMCLVPKPTRLR